MRWIVHCAHERFIEALKRLLQEKEIPLLLRPEVRVEEGNVGNAGEELHIDLEHGKQYTNEGGYRYRRQPQSQAAQTQTNPASESIGPACR